ncbi:hypothetical protein GOODEAATRI_029315, partial [Goodea atripinnis]
MPKAQAAALAPGGPKNPWARKQSPQACAISTSSTSRRYERTEEEAASLTASPYGGSETSSPFSRAAPSSPSSVAEFFRGDTFQAECKSRA